MDGRMELAMLHLTYWTHRAPFACTVGYKRCTYCYWKNNNNYINNNKHMSVPHPQVYSYK